MNKLLEALDNKEDRSAQFKTVIALILNEQTYQFEGICKGNITNEKRGDYGFGYDPIFRPLGYNQSFAELGAEIKNTISHRAKAIAKFVEFMQSFI